MSASSFQRALFFLSAPLLLLALSAALIYWDLTHSNRPHELRFPLLVAGLSTLSALWSGWRLERGMHASQDQKLWQRSLCIALSLALLVLSVLLFYAGLAAYFAA